MVYELIGVETLGDVLAMAGSFTRDAYPSLAILTRKSDSLGLPQASTIDLLDEIQLSLPARDGDTLVVPKVGSLVANSVVLRGAVTRPGSYGWVPGMRVSDLISDARRDLARDVDLGLGMIIRQKNALLDVDVIAFDLASVIASPKTDADPVLKEFDETLVFSSVTSDSGDASRQALLGPVIEKLSSQARQGEPLQGIRIWCRTSSCTTRSWRARWLRPSSGGGWAEDSGFLEVSNSSVDRALERSVTADYRELKIGPDRLDMQPSC